MRYGFVTLPKDIGRALLIGVVLSGVISALIEPDTLRAYLGGGIVPMIAAMAIGIPLYVCATASTPIAASLIVAGLSPGAALVFLITGPATNSASVTTLLKVLGRRTTVVYLLTVALGALATGLIVDGVIASGAVSVSSLLDLAPGTSAHEHQHVGGVGWWIGVVSAVVLVLVVANSMRRRSVGGEEERVVDDREVMEFEVKGMRCNGCVDSVTRALARISGVDDVEVQLERGTARVVGTGMAGPRLLEAITSLGFEAKTLV